MDTRTINKSLTTKDWRETVSCDVDGVSVTTTVLITDQRINISPLRGTNPI